MFQCCVRCWGMARRDSALNSSGRSSQVSFQPLFYRPHVI